jgi:hypothetical protein
MPTPIARHWKLCCTHTVHERTVWAAKGSLQQGLMQKNYYLNRCINKSPSMKGKAFETVENIL